ncbi:SIMPL domain-containing protein [Rhizobiaceae bacterium n13]|uniref:SIMPL domain-containing protein n=2 Tax=Ferirhizobium litorale TaxID=2927786 RepID=A0AAE3QCY0_9HYPH|nr:SIMPL domain-containing protein [Fererhizobium litorale]MDI7860945.1 SIMPL domain-containing protein [Fererhizobium litorale]MDI7921093.1 SIMPL domain-containing protein [Fererhizobium litorale]
MAVFALTTAVPAAAQDGRERPAVITVSGEGEASVAPDMAIVTLGVVRQAKTAREALDDNNKAMAEVLKQLKANGIADRDLQTSGFGIAPQYNYPTDKNGQPMPPELVGYQVTNTLTVRLRDMEKLGALLDTSVSLGINQGGDIRFTNDKPEATVTEARKAAVASALAKAKTLSEAAGVKLGPIVRITETPDRPQPVPVYRAAVAKEMSDGGAVPIAGGENSYNVNVIVTFRLEQ